MARCWTIWSSLAKCVTSVFFRYSGVESAALFIAHFRGWALPIALQIEYSLMQRTVVRRVYYAHGGELGLGAWPWSPLKSGALSASTPAATA